MGREIILTERGKLLLLEDAAGHRHYPKEEDVVLKDDAQTFVCNGYLAASMQDVVTAAGCKEAGLRESYLMLSEKEYAAAVKGAELINWSSKTKYCSCCGVLLHRASEISKKCPGCGREYFPHLSPAIVVLVKKGEEALLVHAKNFSRPGMMALVAGFVETGENLEECVAREIKEETDLEVCDIKYVGSQSWPFPHQLMLGFTANYTGGELKFADGELSAGGFFTRDNVPELPTPPSLSRRIIDMWISGEC